MKTFGLLILFLVLTNCAGAEPSVKITKFGTSGEPPDDIRLMTDMKVSGDTLMFVYETHDGHGQLFVRRAIIDREKHNFLISSSLGKRDDGYYTSYMPYPFTGLDGTFRIVGQDDCEIYDIIGSTAIAGTRHRILDSNFSVPVQLSQHVSDVFVMAPDIYVFMAREPRGARQFVLAADIVASRIDTIRHISVSSDLQAWMPNMGKMAYSDKHKSIVFAYRLHPYIEIFGTDGKTIKSVRIGEDTFDPRTLDEADFDSLNILHTIYLTLSRNYIYVLYRASVYSEQKADIIKLDFEGNIIDRYRIDTKLSSIAATGDHTLVGWDGANFLYIELY